MVERHQTQWDFTMVRNVLVVVALTMKNIFLIFYFAILETLKQIFPQKFMKSVGGDVVLITGGGSGIGRLMAQKLASLGAIVVTLDINEKGNDETVESIKQKGFEAFGYKCDLGNKDDVYSAAEKVKSQVGRVTILINNAGIVSGSPLVETSDDKIRKTFDVNVFAHFWLAKSFLPDMIINKKGHIITVASIAGLSGANKLTDYCASKFANVGFDDALRTELYVQGHSSYINTTLICPYYINTGMFAGVRSKIFSILEPEYVADQSIEAILTNRQFLALPKGPGLVACLMKGALPSRAFTIWAQFLGLNSTMDNFKGRK